MAIERWGMRRLLARGDVELWILSDPVVFHVSLLGPEPREIRFRRWPVRARRYAAKLRLPSASPIPDLSKFFQTGFAVRRLTAKDEYSAAATLVHWMMSREEEVAISLASIVNADRTEPREVGSIYIVWFKGESSSSGIRWSQRLLPWSKRKFLAGRRTRRCICESTKVVSASPTL